MVFDNIQDGICVIDEKGRVLIWNGAIEKIYNVSAKEILGEPLLNFFPNAIDDTVLKTGKTFRDLRHSPKPGSHVLISAAPIKKGNKLIGVVSTDRDMKDVQKLKNSLNSAMDKIKSLQQKIVTIEQGEEFFRGSDKAVLEAMEAAELAAPTDLPILITGDTGTGKEVMARNIHKLSGVKGKFISVNCSAIPDTLFESEFFGYAKGAFTGADSQGRAGYFEQASEGTLFLDEIGVLPIQQQSKLLRAIQEGFVRPLGSEKDIPVNVRIISATNVDLDDLVKKKEFRIDLYFRLKGITIRMPSLKERSEDVIELINYFFQYYNVKYSKKLKSISPEALKSLLGYDWPGNIRELRNMIRQLVVMSVGEEITYEALPDEVKYFGGLSTADGRSGGLMDRVEKIEKSIIEGELKANLYNLAQTAKALDIPRSTLQYKIKKFGLSSETD
ncbi:MAG: sigma 54-interacting transcriptional regulator [Clostridiaceae bacterium]